LSAVGVVFGLSAEVFFSSQPMAAMEKTINKANSFFTGIPQ
jgi:hypothetical protein